MNGLGAWAEMGGYAGYVWPAYGAALIVLGGIALQSWWRYWLSRRSLDRAQRASPER